MWCRAQDPSFLPPSIPPSLPSFFFLSFFLDIGSFIFKPHADRRQRGGWLNMGPNEAYASLSLEVLLQGTNHWAGLVSVCSAALPACLKGRLATLGFRLMAPPTVGRQHYPEPLKSEGLHFCRLFLSLNCSFLDIKNRFIKSLVRSLG